MEQMGIFLKKFSMKEMSIEFSIYFSSLFNKEVIENPELLKKIFNIYFIF